LILASDDEKSLIKSLSTSNELTVKIQHIIFCSSFSLWKLQNWM